ncbi:MAG: NosD domain-containing protein, partial [Thermoplasmatota archaeon]
MNKKIILRLTALTAATILILTSTVLTVQSVPPVPQKTWVVDSTGKGDFTKIQDAINNAKGGDTITIKKGIYYEDSINVNKMVTIQGQGIEDTIIDCKGKQGITLNTSAVEISDLKIINPIEYGIYVSPRSTRCTISNIYIEPTTYIGIYVRGAETKIINCDIRGASLTYGNGILLRESKSIVKDCNIQGFSIAILILLNSDNHLITNCNLFNNEEAIDIRIDSDRNIVTECNIYANELGVYIWQNSNNNQIYLNNFWRNKIDAKSEGNNKWDNNSRGNYWGNLDTIDANKDGISDKPYTISEGNVDNYPLTSMIPSDKIMPPTLIRLTTSVSNNRPSFAWSPAFSVAGIKGYYIKIDNKPEIFIGNAESWTSTDTILDGAHTFYIRAVSNDNKTTDYASIKFSIDTTFIDLDGDGWSDVDETLYGTDPNNPDNYPIDSDGDGTPDSIDTDNDNDGLNDAIELHLGSNPKDKSDVKKIYPGGKPYFIVDVNQDDTYDLLYDLSTNTSLGLEKSGDKYLLDINNNGKWDYIYNTIDGSVSKIEEEQTALTQTIWIGIIIIIIVTILLLFYYIIKRPTKPVAPKTTVEKPITEEIKTHPSIKTETILEKQEAADETKALLKLIHKDFTTYMEKLQQITEQLASSQQKEKERKEETMKSSVDEKHPQKRDVEEIKLETEKKISSKYEDKREKLFKEHIVYYVEPKEKVARSTKEIVVE